MQLNLPIFDLLEDSQNILITGIGGGFDVFAGLPIYFTLRAMGKNVHLANYSFTEFRLAQIVSNPIVEIETLLMGAQGKIASEITYYPEGYLAQWFAERGEDVIVWMFARQGIASLQQCYAHLVKKLNIDAIIAIDGGVDSLMRGDEVGAGTMLEDTISLGAMEKLDVPVKILAAIGFGTETEEGVCHYSALENMAALTKAGACYGGCALISDMDVFHLYEAASRYVWEQPNHQKSHISTRIIPAVHGEFGNYHMYPDDARYTVSVSPLMSLYWFFDLNTVVHRNHVVKLLRDTYTQEDAMRILMAYRQDSTIMRPRRNIPY